MKKLLRVGIIGLGKMGKWHLQDYIANKKAKIVAVSDINERMLKEVAEKLEVKCFTDYNDLLDLSELDAISVCTPPFNHSSITCDAAEKEKHILIEKPMAMNSREAAIMVECCKKSSVNLAVCSSRDKFSPQAAKARKYVSEGKLGKIYYGKVSFYRRRGRPGIDIMSASKWFTDSSKAGGGAFMDLGCYEIDTLLYLLGNPIPVSVSAAMFQGIEPLSEQKTRFDVEEHASVLVRFKEGLAVMFEISWATNFNKTHETILLGSKAGLKLFPFTIYTTTKGKQISTTTDLARNHFSIINKMLIDDFVTSCLKKKAPKTSGNQGLTVMKIIEAAYKSAELEREVMISDL